MKKALGMIEFKTVASGITATDLMLKTAEVEVVQAGAVCPGKYLATITGEISAVKAAVEAAERYNAAMLIDRFILGNPHETVVPAISGPSGLQGFTLFAHPMGFILGLHVGEGVFISFNLRRISRY